LGDKKATLPRAKELLMMLNIRDFDLYPDELSGGMKARVSIARALARKSNIYIFDEPFANLDKETAMICIDTIKKEAEGALVIVVMHDIELAERVADKIINL
jgi:NitT/TauT family transport system ATP-binding protein